MLGRVFVLPGTQGKKIAYHLRETLLVQDNIQDARIIAPTYFRNEAAKLSEVPAVVLESGRWRGRGVVSSKPWSVRLVTDEDLMVCSSSERNKSTRAG